MTSKERIYRFLHLDKIKSRILKEKVLKYYEKEESAKDYQRELEYIKKNNCQTFNDEFTEKYKSVEYNIEFDKKVNMYYIMHNDKKLYFKRGMTKREVQEYYKSLKVEQDEKSPHCYQIQRLRMNSYRKILDIGAAEGIFALDMIDRCDEVIMYEYDSRWIDALEKTFEPYQNKIRIVKCYVSDRDEGIEKTLNKMLVAEEDIDLIKMDIEGAEVRAIIGALEVLNRNKQALILICVYHNAKDEEKIRNLLTDYQITMNAGKMIYPNRYPLCISKLRLEVRIDCENDSFFTNGVIFAKYEGDK